jgi:ethylbenzene dioxygenase subunit beta
MPVNLGEHEALCRPEPPVFGPAAPREVHEEVTLFLHREARLLDEERYPEWLGLMTDDVHYWMPGIQARYRNDRQRAPDPRRMAHFDDDMLGMRRRATRFLQATAWAEDPPTRCVRVIGNIEVELAEPPDEYLVHSTFVNCRGRNETDEDVLHGRRRDTLRRTEAGLKLARREIYVTQAVLKSKNLNVFL